MLYVRIFDLDKKNSPKLAPLKEFRNSAGVYLPLPQI